VYCSIDKIDLATRLDGQAIAVQTDHRNRDELEAEPELTVLFAMARVVNARSQLADDGHPRAAVHYVVSADPPTSLREALTAAGATLERADLGLMIERLAPGSEDAVGALADHAFSELAHRTAVRVGTRDVAMALHMLEAQTFANPPSRDDEVAYWSRVLELAALAGELLRAKYGGQWIQTDRALVPFGFQLFAAGEATILFPTNRAQRVIEDGPDESLFKLLVAAEETVQRPTTLETGRLMPSLRHRRDVVLDEVVWRPVISEDTGGPPPDLPIIVCGVDGESTFGMLRREALGKPPDAALEEALANLAGEEVQIDELEIGDEVIVLVTGSYYAAEKVLDRDFMRALHVELDADLLAAATPARGCLLVAALTEDPSTIARFAALAQSRHDDSGGRSISPTVMLVADGRIAGYVRGPDDDQPEPDPFERADTSPAAPKKHGLLRRLLGRK